METINWNAKDADGNIASECGRFSVKPHGARRRYVLWVDGKSYAACLKPTSITACKQYAEELVRGEAAEKASDRIAEDHDLIAEAVANPPTNQYGIEETYHEDDGSPEAEAYRIRMADDFEPRDPPAFGELSAGEKAVLTPPTPTTAGSLFVARVMAAAPKKTKAPKPPQLKAGNADAPAPPVPELKAAAKRQAILDELLWSCGRNAPEWPDWSERLTDAGLVPAEVTDAMVRRAEEAAVKRLQGNIDAPEIGPVRWLPPVKQDTEVAAWDVWATECRRLRVIRAIPKFAGDPPRFKVGAVRIVTPKGEDPRVIHDVTGRDYRSLERAMEEAERILKDRHGVHRIDSNRHEVIAAAKRDGLDLLPTEPQPYNETTGVAVDPTIPEEESIMQLSEKAARRLLVASGAAEAKELWSVKKISIRLNDLSKAAEDLELKRPDGDQGETWDEVIKANKGKKAVLVGEKPAPAEAKAKPSKAPSKNGKAERNGSVEKLEGRPETKSKYLLAKLDRIDKIFKKEGREGLATMTIRSDAIDGDTKKAFAYKQYLLGKK